MTKPYGFTDEDIRDIFSSYKTQQLQYSPESVSDQIYIESMRAFDEWLRSVQSEAWLRGARYASLAMASDDEWDSRKNPYGPEGI